MQILAIDACTELCAVALGDGTHWRHRTELAGQRHSELLLPAIEGLLRDAGMTLAQLDGIAFGAGPGSFTGLRIACGVAQGLALGSGLPVIGISTLEAMAEAAWQSDGASRVIAALDARMQEVYVAAYERVDGRWNVRVEPCVVKPADAPLPPGSGWVACGNALAAYSALRDRLQPAVMAYLDATAPTAVAIGTLALPMLAAGRGVAAADAEPIYVRHRVAQTIAERLTATHQ
jgi:tRNA threonylcarbamoyladenosine biosynthesis protein TsaB